MMVVVQVEDLLRKKEQTCLKLVCCQRLCAHRCCKMVVVQVEEQMRKEGHTRLKLICCQ